MRIGIDASRAVTGQRTGTEAYAYFLIQALLPLATGRNHEVHLYFNHAPPPDLFPAVPGVHHHILPFPRLWTHLRLAAHLERQRPDVFFTPAHVIPLTYRGPSVATVHDLGYRFFPQAHTRSQVAYLHWSTAHNARRSRLSLADSQATKRDLVQQYGIRPDKIHVVYPGIDPTLAPVTDPAQLAAVQQKYGIRAPYLLYVGTLQPRKNLERLVRAYAASGLTEYQLVLAGRPGWQSEGILVAVQEVNGQQPERPAIHLPGFVDEADKAALLSGATALLYPSLYEGFGFPVLEAQACGTPVLCADNSSLPEVAGDAALLVDAADQEAICKAMCRLVEDGALRERLVQAGFANVQRFRWQEAAGQVLEVLEAAAAVRRPVVRKRPGASEQSRLPVVQILGVPVHEVSKAETLALMRSFMAEPRLHQAATVNPEFVMAAQRDPAFRAVLQDADLCLADGVGILLAARRYGRRLPERVPGSELVYCLAEAAAQAGWRLFLLGAAPGVAEEAAAVLQARYPGLIIAGTYSGSPDPAENAAIVQRINDSRADILYVAYGAPRQDKWIARNRETLKTVRLAMGVGGALDFITGRAVRAPEWMQKLGLEWLHRLYREPWRWRRMLALPRFAWRVFTSRPGGGYDLR